MLVHEENPIRRRNELPELIVPADSTLRSFRAELLTPTEYLTATKGERHARNKRGRGSTDIRALCVGELVEIDECKMSLVSSAKKRGFWDTLSSDHRAVLKEIDKEIRARLILLVMIDVASRMPLAWIISDQPKATATLALYRMATRDKTREKIVYGCDGDPTYGVGIGNLRMDNGTGLRNSTSVGALVGLGATATVVRAFNSTDESYVERLLGTTESVLLQLIHGYTGRKAGELPGYDAKANGVLDIDELYGVLTRFFIDEYPSTPHMGVGMGGRRPYEVYRHINDTRGLFELLDPDMRRIHLGWEIEATPNDEGVRVFGGLWYSSPDFQKKVDGFRGKVSVFVDPDDVTQATVLVPGSPNPFEVQIQITAFADLALHEVLELLAAWRKEHPSVTEIHEDRIMRTRRQRLDQLRAIGVERKLPRSYSTFEECRTKATAVMAGARIVRTEQLPGTATVGRLAQLDAGGAVFRIGPDKRVIEGTPVERMTTDADLADDLDDPTRAATKIDVAVPPVTPALLDNGASSPVSGETTTRSSVASRFLGRPTDLKKPE